MHGQINKRTKALCLLQDFRKTINYLVFTCHRVEIYDEGDKQKGFSGDEAEDEEEGNPEVEVDTDGPATAGDSKDHPQEEDEKNEDVDRARTCADSLVHLGCKDMQENKRQHN